VADLRFAIEPLIAIFRSVGDKKLRVQVNNDEDRYENTPPLEGDSVEKERDVRRVAWNSTSGNKKTERARRSQNV